MSVLGELGKARNFRSLMFTLAIAFLALSFVVLAISSGLQIYLNMETQTEILAENQQLIAKDAANSVKGFLQERLLILESAASVSDLMAVGEERQELILDKLLGVEPSFRQIFLLDDQSQELMKVSRMSVTMSRKMLEYSKDEIFSHAKEKEDYISPVNIDEITNEPMIIMSVPVTDVFGNLEGVLSAEVNLKFMWDLVGGLEIGKEGIAYVVDNQGDLIAFGDISRVLRGENLARLEEVKEFVSGDELTHKSDFEVSTGILGSQVVANHAHLGNPDWAVVVEMPVEEAYETVATGIMFSALSMFIILLLAIFAGIYLSRKITKPLIDLKNAAIEIGKGSLSTKIDITTKDEIGELAQAFNQMTADLKKSHEEIKKYAEELELKVQERTSELKNRVKDMSDTKTAVLNMMEDMDEANKELIETQEKLKISLKELEEIDMKKDQFISIAAHELKTPLTSIHGFSQLLQNRKVADDLDKRGKYLKIMDHETKRLSRLVTDILDLSRIDLGTIKLALEKTDLDKMMEDIKREMEIQIKAKGLKSEFLIERNLPAVTTDREKLTEVVINLINNAVKYTPKGSITVKVFREKDDIRFTVKDTGIGISKENHEKIFERFYQVDSSYSRKAGGTGLGLALCKEFITMLGGKIWMNSEPDKGSEFHLSLPAKKVPKSHMRKEERMARETLKKSQEMGKKLESLING